ncbi:MAG: hypothetical protein M3P34_04425, partial [Actinomycetota bacterium]|nr:hypothetical protein [Actinomycetota bacterium]
IAPSRSLYLASHAADCAAAPNRWSPCSFWCIFRTMARGGQGVPYRPLERMANGFRSRANYVARVLVMCSGPPALSPP